PLKPFMVLNNCPSFTMDYKLPSSGMEDAMCIDNLLSMKKKDTVKFVTGNFEDLDRAKEIIDKYQLTEKCNVYISPVFGKIDPADIVEYLKNNKMNYVTMQLQMHKFIWNPNAKGV
ncbi:MAG: 7-carboxy-7-deazaguanine synthase QueE, partial [Lachnospiraceae bacterium]|nr:7-carboxy-7-deazaguanine synthase QueE [Lachnospiraceae bacterium]